MKRLAIVGLLAAGAVSAQAQSFIEQARVRSVEPQYQNVTIPRNECTTQLVSDPPRQVSADRNYGGAVIGGVAGGVLGHQVGKGHGKDAATIVGAVVGAIRDQAAPQYVQSAPREVQQCRTVNEVQQQLTGYRVNYEYHGQLFSTITRDNPGHSLPVRVSVVPAEQR